MSSCNVEALTMERFSHASSFSFQWLLLWSLAAVNLPFFVGLETWRTTASIFHFLYNHCPLWSPFHSIHFLFILDLFSSIILFFVMMVPLVGESLTDRQSLTSTSFTGCYSLLTSISFYFLYLIFPLGLIFFKILFKFTSTISLFSSNSLSIFWSIINSQVLISFPSSLSCHSCSTGSLSSL